MSAFHQTGFGQQLLGRDVPRFLTALERVAVALERLATALDRLAGEDATALADTINRPRPT
jgi:hypothetical protein